MSCDTRERSLISNFGGTELHGAFGALAQLGQNQRARERIDTRHMAALTIRVKRERDESWDFENLTEEPQQYLLLCWEWKSAWVQAETVVVLPAVRVTFPSTAAA